MARVAIALGSNVGDRLAHLRGAVSDLARIGEIVAVSRLYETQPVGGPTQGSFLNAVVVVDTELSPVELLTRTQEIENRHGRTRAVHWGPRTLDLDLVAHDEEAISSPSLEIPHPRAARRRFVVAPLIDVWPDALLAPGLTAADAGKALPPGGELALAGDWLREPPSLGRRGAWLVGAQMVLLAATAALTLMFRGADPPAWSRVGGAVLFGAAAVVGAWAAGLLGSQLRAGPDPRPGAVLIESGPYRLVRHPIYAAVVIGLAGVVTFLAAWPALAGVAAVAALYAAKARYEERILAVNLPGYGDYLGRVDRRFLPYLW